MRNITPHDEALITNLLDRPVSPEVQALTDHLKKRRGVVAILFYGNFLRDPKARGLIDLYVITERNRSYHGTGFACFFNWVLPPNVYFEEIDTDTGTIQAKIAVISLTAFTSKMKDNALDTTLWARFCQPTVLTFYRDKASRKAVLSAIYSAYHTALTWAQRFHPDEQDASALWIELFTQTYQAELRVERENRPQQIVDTAHHVYQSLLDNTPVRDQGSSHRKDRTGWLVRRKLGKLLNFFRLIKAAFTYEGGFDYALQKVEKHSKQPVILKNWERRLPWLAAPLVFVRLLLDRRLR